MPENDRTYLGDGVHAELTDRGKVKLTATCSFITDDTIVLDELHIERLIRFLRAHKFLKESP